MGDRSTPTRTLRPTLLAVAVLLAAPPGAGGVPAQDDSPATPPDSRTALKNTTAMVVLADQELFEEGSQSVVSPGERAAALGEGILATAKSRRVSVNDLRLQRDNRIHAALVMAHRQLIGAIQGQCCPPTVDHQGRPVEPGATAPVPSPRT